MTTTYDPVTDTWTSTWCSGGATVQVDTPCNGTPQTPNCSNEHRANVAAINAPGVLPEDC